MSERLVLTNSSLIDAVTPRVDNVRTLQMVFKGGRLVADHRETGGGPRRGP